MFFLFYTMFVSYIIYILSLLLLLNCCSQVRQAISRAFGGTLRYQLLTLLSTRTKHLFAESASQQRRP